MKKFLYLLVPVILAASCGPRDGSYTFYICSTNDVHGRYFDSLYVGTGISGSLLAVSSAVDSIRNAAGPENVILIDAGDCVQGDNASYYYNYVDTVSPHLYARMVSYMGYDAVVVGNHDIEAGHPVYDRFRKELPCPFLAANALKVRPDGSVSGRPYFQDYLIQTRNGIRIAIIGFTNPNIKNWLSPDLWSGMEFVSLIPYVQEYVDRVRKKEKPDIVIVAAHTGTGQGLDPEQIEAVRTSGAATGEPLYENQGLALFQTLEGVDFVADGNVAVQGVLAVRVGRQGPDVERTVSEIGGQAVLIVIVDDPHGTAVPGILSYAPDVVQEEVEALHTLHQGGRCDVHLGTRPPVQQRQCPGQGGGEAGFDVLPRNVDQGFMVAQNAGAGQFEPHQIVDDEFVKWLQKEGLSSKRRTVQPFSLLVADCFLDDPDTKLRVPRV